MKHGVSKFRIPSESIWNKESFSMDLPEYCDIIDLKISKDVGFAYIFALTCDTDKTTKRNFEIYATGEEMSFNFSVERKYIGTFEYGRAEFYHLFEKIS